MEKQEMILYVSFVKVYCESFKRTYGALMKKSQEYGCKDS